MLRTMPVADVAMLPVNGRDWYRETDVGAVGNLLPAEAARLTRDLGWDVLIPGHNDLYPNNTIPAGHIVEALAKVAPRQKFKILQPGELYYYIKS
jgi:L-ascorbate metabolism protein UlaG (beta-lactamase superfamily)